VCGHSQLVPVPAQEKKKRKNGVASIRWTVRETTEMTRPDANRDAVFAGCMGVVRPVYTGTWASEKGLGRWRERKEVCGRPPDAQEGNRFLHRHEKGRGVF